MNQKAYYLPQLGGAAYQNPLTVEVENRDQEQEAQVLPDPYVLKHNGEYYAYATGGHGVKLLRSKDLVSWTYHGCALQQEGQKNFWAPSVIYENGTFYMYYSSMPEQEDDVHLEFMKVAVSSSPGGPFRYVKTFFGNFSIDAHVVRQEDGDLYLYYSVNDYTGTAASRPGTVILRDRMVDLLTPEGKPELVLTPSMDEEIFARNRFGDGRDWHTIEGAFYLRRRGKHYVMYSGNAFTHEHYYVGYAVSADGRNWRKYPDDYTYGPVIRRNARVEGTGHHSLALAPNNVDLWMVYHGRDATQPLDPAREQRQLRMDPLLWNGERMWTPGPTYVPQDAPAMPTFRDLFEDADGKPAEVRWQVLAGEWEQRGGELTQTSRACAGAIVSASAFRHYVGEVSLRGHHYFTGGVYGVYACYQDDGNYILVQLDAGRRSLSMHEVRGGIRGQVSEVMLPKDFRFDCSHQLRIEKVGGYCRVLLDGLPRLGERYSLQVGAIGLATRYSAASFASVEVTGHLQCAAGADGEFAALFEAAETGGAAAAWTFEQGAFVCGTDRPAAEHAVFSTDRLPAGCQVQVDFARESQAASRSAVFYAAYVDATNYLKFEADFASAEVRGQMCRAGDKLDLPPIRLAGDLEQQVLHAFRFKKHHERLFVMLNETVIYDDLTAFEDERFGFGCRGRARFEGITVTELTAAEPR
ncbi:glycoside hydrolase family 43 protein [Paenibacillus xanthanilyticus]|uniref:Glycoside hydrolase family 43 protein n=1 Tax=Paenibacillus xanthanilyticus TaxID=1783531 RepID=A0ABV8K1S0_9BACL